MAKLAAGLLMGAQGGIGSTYNVMPEVYVAIYKAAQSADWERARRLQMGVTAMIKLLLRYPFFPALRALMEAQGMDCGPMMSRECFSSAAQKQNFLAEFNQRFSEVFPQFAAAPASSRS